MLKQNKRNLLITTLLILIPAAVGLILWNRLPQKLPIHWNVRGEVDGYGSRGFVVFGLPLVLTAVQWLCVLGTAADKKNKGQNKKVLSLILWFIPLLSNVVMGITYGTVLGYAVPMHSILCVIMGILFAVIGNYLPKCKPNYTIGIRIPWTLRDEGNWYYTHRLAGRLWLAGGIVVLLCGFLPPVAAACVFLPVTLLMVIIPVTASGIYAKKHRNKE